MFGALPLQINYFFTELAGSRDVLVERRDVSARGEHGIVHGEAVSFRLHFCFSLLDVANDTVHVFDGGLLVGTLFRMFERFLCPCCLLDRFGEVPAELVQLVGVLRVALNESGPGLLDVLVGLLLLLSRFAMMSSQSLTSM